MNISILVPTRKRVNNVKRLLQSIHDTALHSELIEIIFYVDHDDQESIDFIQALSNNSKIKTGIKLHIDKRDKPGYIYEQLYKKAAGNIIMTAADDIKFNTKKWDYLVQEEFNFYPDKILLVFGYDGLQPPGSIATHYFQSREAIEKVGYVMPKDFGYNYSDNWMTTMYRAIGRLSYIPIYVEHIHWGAGKAPYDEIYKEGSDAPHEESIKLYQDKERRDKDIEILKQGIDENLCFYDRYYEEEFPL